MADLDFKGDAHAAALDLSLADGRFAPDVLEVTARRAVTAWAEAVDGDDARLRSIAHGQAVRALLYPGDPSGHTRLVVRGPKVNHIRITGLDAAAQPPTMTVEVDIEAGATSRIGIPRRSSPAASPARRSSPSIGRSRSTVTPAAVAARRRRRPGSAGVAPTPKGPKLLTPPVIPLKDNIPTDRFRS